MNEDTYNLLYYLYLSEEGRRQIENMSKIRFSNNKWELYMPIIFFYSKNAGLAIPTIAMPNTENNGQVINKNGVYVLNII